MHQATAADSANRDETSEEIKATKKTRTAIVSSIMEKYTLADPWPAKNEKVCYPGKMVGTDVTDPDGSVSVSAF